MLAVRLPKNIEERLEQLAIRNERSKSYYVKKALEKLLEDEDEKERALKAYQNFLDSSKKIHTFADVMAENGL
ncbi:MAG: ribbon-helix-helix protein, CopG family [Proteobacteria bacterium]|nr:ribbon-helix-helix protein, CopG family [Pseudomonadota bacterium]